MYLAPTYFIDAGLRAIMRNPFFNLPRLSLQEGESDFRLLEGREGVVVTLGPNTSFFDRPSRSVCRWPGTKTVPRQSPHPVPRRSRIRNELGAFMRIFCGGGDVKLNRIETVTQQQQILLTAGEGNVVEKIDLTELAREGAPPLRLLQPAYLCSTANVTIHSVPCDASAMSWARAPYVYRTGLLNDLFKPAILCLSGRTMVWRERLAPGESRDFALGNVIAATLNVASKLRPTSQRHPDDCETTMFERGDAGESDATSAQSETAGKRTFGARIRDSAAAVKVLFESIRAREGFLVCEMSNHSRKPAYVFVQLNKGAFYGGSGFVGVILRIVSAFFRFSHVSIGG